jgi:hypothetical protein
MAHRETRERDPETDGRDRDQVQTAQGKRLESILDEQYDDPKRGAAKRLPVLVLHPSSLPD